MTKPKICPGRCFCHLVWWKPWVWRNRFRSGRIRGEILIALMGLVAKIEHAPLKADLCPSHYKKTPFKPIDNLRQRLSMELCGLRLDMTSFHQKGCTRLDVSGHAFCDSCAC